MVIALDDSTVRIDLIKQAREYLYPRSIHAKFLSEIDAPAELIFEIINEQKREFLIVGC